MAQSSGLWSIANGGGGGEGDKGTLFIYAGCSELVELVKEEQGIKGTRYWGYMGACAILGAAALVIGEEPIDPRKELGCSYMEISGTAQGGACGIGFTLNRNPPRSVKTTAGETAAKIAARLAEALRAEDKLTVDVVDGTSTLCVYNTTEGQLYFHSTDLGIRSGEAVQNLRSESDPASKTAKLTWQLPDPKPDAIYIFGSASEPFVAGKQDTEFVYDYPQHNGWGRWFYVVCGYNSSDGSRITRLSDLRKVWVDNPRQMTSKELKIVVDPNSLPFLLNREDAYSLTKVGGTNPCVWSITQGTLPAGLTMDANGRISGKATQLGLRTITVKLRDAKGAETSAGIDVEVFNIPLYKKSKD